MCLATPEKFERATEHTHAGTRMPALTYNQPSFTFHFTFDVFFNNNESALCDGIYPDVRGLNDDECGTPNQPYDVDEGDCGYGGKWKRC